MPSEDRTPDAELAALEALLARATNRPWSNTDREGWITADAGEAELFSNCEWFGNVDLTEEADANNALIVSAVNALPGLIATARTTAGIAAELAAVRGEAEEWRLRLYNLLAVIHRDGGHRLSEVGTVQAVEEAMQLSAERVHAAGDANRARLAAERKLEAAVEAHERVADARSALDGGSIEECRRISRTFLATLNTGAEHG